MSPNSKIFVIVESLMRLPWDGSTYFIYLMKEGFPNTRMIEAIEGGKWVVVSISWPQEHIGKTQSWNFAWICDHLNDWAGHKLVSNFNFLINFNSSCLINFNGSSLKTLIKEKFEILLLRSFHSLITALKKESLKNYVWSQNSGFRCYENFLYHRCYSLVEPKNIRGKKDLRYIFYETICKMELTF